MAGIVVLCLGVYPEVGGLVWDWVKDGAIGVMVETDVEVGVGEGGRGRGLVWDRALGKWVKGQSLVSSRQAAEMAARARGESEQIRKLSCLLVPYTRFLLGISLSPPSFRSIFGSFISMSCVLQVLLQLQLPVSPVMIWPILNIVTV